MNDKYKKLLFKKWLELELPKSSSKYLNYFNRVCEIAFKNGLGSLYEWDNEEWINKENSLRNISEFSGLNKSGHNSLTASISNYKKFMQEQKMTELNYIPVIPFSNFGWRWATTGISSKLNKPVAIFTVLDAILINGNGASNQTIEFKNLVKTVASKKYEITDDQLLGTLSRIESADPVKNVIENSGNYWRHLGLIDSAGKHARVTDLGKDFLKGNISKELFIKDIVQNYKLPSSSYPLSEIEEFEASNLEIYPLKLILEILEFLKVNHAENAFITEIDLNRIIVPLSSISPQISLNDYANYLIKFRESPDKFSEWPTCVGHYSEDKGPRMLNEFMYFLEAFEVLESNLGIEQVRSSTKIYKLSDKYYSIFHGKSDNNIEIINNENSDIVDGIYSPAIHISKPFILLPGISGTGKSRFVRQQVSSSYSLIVPVRPDWHEPSDLLGYVSRIGGKPEYVGTGTLLFMAEAWKNAYFSASSEDIVLKSVSEMQTYWLCLDEMNLAPVEQYFADYLSVLESRKWDGTPDSYSCDPILRIPDGVQNIRTALGLEAAEFDGLWNYFSAHGMPLPPNLIVAGTVNMDETTHGFSRKVIDRALTFDFGEFFPNDFGDYFGQSEVPVRLGFPTMTHIDNRSQLAGVAADKDGVQSIAFLSQVNDVLMGTSFELAYRALNELLLSVYFHSPADAVELQAVWDDFIMMKVLPRIEGDNEKLASRTDDNSNVIQQLEQLLLPLFPEDGKRIDFYRTGKDGVHPSIPFRSMRKLRWMKQRLTNNGFTSFWP